MAKKLKIYNGSSWEDVTFAITPPTTAVTNAFTTNQVIDTSTSVAALRITQRGSGEAFRVEDDTNPDSSPFVINAAGNVAIGSSSPQAMLHLERDSTGEIGAFIWNTNASGYAALRIGNSDRGTNGDHLIFGSSVLGLRSKTGSAITFQPAGTERMRIHSDGNISIGTTTNEGKVLISSGDPTTELNIRAYDDASKMMTIQADNNVLRFISRWTGGSGGEIAWSTGQPISERLRLSSSGQFFLLAAQENAQPRIRNTYTSTSTPSGGNDGDMWATYV
jgi:hypothetical protein